MDWENHPLMFILFIALAAALSAIAAGLKEVNGKSFRWRRFVCRSVYRGVVGLAAGLIMSTRTDDVRLIWGAVMILNVMGIGEDMLLRLLPFKFHDWHDKTSKDRQDA